MLSWQDYVVLAGYAGIIITIGIITGRKEKNITDYFLGGRSMPWWSVMISIYATALSALTFIGVPGAAFRGDFHYLQLGFGDLVGRILISFVLLKPYYKHQVTTVYELLDNRFGKYSRGSGTLFFLVTRLLASGVRLAGCAIALSVIFDIPMNLAIVIIGVVALIYTSVGGIKAVIWTDSLQFILFIAAASVVIWLTVNALPGGFNEFVSLGQEFSKFKIFHFSFNPASQDFWLNLSNPQSFIAGFLFGAFTTFAALGTDQDLVQRMLTCKKVTQSQIALIFSGLLNFPVTLLFLTLGAGLFVFFKINPDPVVADFVVQGKTDYIFPYFIKTFLSPGIKGLLIAGLLAAAMSSLDSAINALASTAYVDIYKAFINKQADPRKAVRISRILVAGFSVVLIGIAVTFSNTESILWLGFKIVGYTYGAMLGIFLLGVLTKTRGKDWVNAIIMISSVGVVLFFTSESAGFMTGIRTVILKPLGIEKIAWPWAIIMGTVWTFGWGLLFRTKKQLASNE
jgi:solute:Na+ symporter, SSS family